MKNKNVKVSKRPRPNYKKERPAPLRAKQTRKGGKGTALMHAAAVAQSRGAAAASNMGPAATATGAKPEGNLADAALYKLTGPNKD